eukprot:3255074-Lingulodinium_polyedra.AAC.1
MPWLNLEHNASQPREQDAVVALPLPHDQGDAAGAALPQPEQIAAERRGRKRGFRPMNHMARAALAAAGIL